MRNRLSGRNITIILIVLAMALFLLSTGCKKSSLTKSPDQNSSYNVTMVINSVEPPVAEAFRVGDAVYVKKDGKKIGTIKRFVVSKSRNVIPTDDGRLVTAYSPIQKRVMLYLDAKGYDDDTGIYLFGTRVLINAYETFISPGIQFDATILSIEKKK